MGGMQPDSTEIKSGLLPRFPGRRACEVNLQPHAIVLRGVAGGGAHWSLDRSGDWTFTRVDHDTCAGERRIQFSLQAFCISRTSIDSSERA